MSRNSSGVYTLPNAPVVTNTTITSTDENTTRSDIASEITNSLDRNGRGAMLAPLQLADGTPSLPGLTFGTDTDTGMYRIAANIIGFAVAGALALTIAATGITFAVAAFTPIVDSGSGTLALKGAGTTAVTITGADVLLAGKLSFSTAVGKIIPGATSISYRNNADNADNLLIADAGGITVRSTIGGVTTLAASTSVVTPLVGASGGSTLGLQANGGTKWVVDDGPAAIYPVGNGNSDLGNATHVIQKVYAGFIDTGTTGSLVLRTNNGTQQLVISDASKFTFGKNAGNVGAFLQIQGWSSGNKNWEISADGSAAGLHFRPSTAAGGTTFTTDVFTISEGGSITLGASPTIAVTSGTLAITPSVVIAGASLTIDTSAAVASAGSIRLPNTGSIQARNAVNSGDVSMVQMQTINGIADIIIIGGAGLVAVTRSGAGAPTTTDLAVGRSTVWRDTTGNTTKVYYNNAGAIIASAAFA